MNLRIHKKLSKRAAKYIEQLGETRKLFPAPAYECYFASDTSDYPLKNWERSPCHPTYVLDKYRTGRLEYTRAGVKYVRTPPHHPLRGTVMVGAMSGYYEPEWDEETAYESLLNILNWHYCDISEALDEEGNMELLTTSTRRLSTVTEVFKAADEMLEEKNERNIFVPDTELEQIAA